MNFTGVLVVIFSMQRRLESLNAENRTLKLYGMRCIFCNWAAFRLLDKHTGNAYLCCRLYIQIMVTLL